MSLGLRRFYPRKTKPRSSMTATSPSEWFQQYLYQPTPTTVLGDPPAPAKYSNSRVGALSPRQEGRASKPTRKRARASRKNPTTLLSTDTSNFRAMVQMYTGGVGGFTAHQGQMRPGGSAMLGSGSTTVSSPSPLAAAVHLQHRLLLHNATAPHTFSLADHQNNNNNNNNNASSATSMAADPDQAAPCGPTTWPAF